MHSLSRRRIRFFASMEAIMAAAVLLGCASAHWPVPTSPTPVTLALDNQLGNQVLKFPTTKVGGYCWGTESFEYNGSTIFTSNDEGNLGCAGAWWHDGVTYNYSNYQSIELYLTRTFDAAHVLPGYIAGQLEVQAWGKIVGTTVEWSYSCSATDTGFEASVEYKCTRTGDRAFTLTMTRRASSNLAAVLPISTSLAPVTITVDNQLGNQVFKFPTTKVGGYCWGTESFEYNGKTIVSSNDEGNLGCAGAWWHDGVTYNYSNYQSIELYLTRTFDAAHVLPGYISGQLEVQGWGKIVGTTVEWSYSCSATDTGFEASVEYKCTRTADRAFTLTMTRRAGSDLVSVWPVSTSLAPVTITVDNQLGNQVFKFPTTKVGGYCWGTESFEYNSKSIVTSNDEGNLGCVGAWWHDGMTYNYSNYQSFELYLTRTFDAAHVLPGYIAGQLAVQAWGKIVGTTVEWSYSCSATDTAFEASVEYKCTRTAERAFTLTMTRRDGSGLVSDFPLMALV